MKNKKIKMKKNEKAAIAELKKRVLEKFPSAEFTLFGSVARGTSTPESDIDVLVIVKGEKQMSKIKNQIYNAAYKIELEHDVIFGIIVDSRDDWKKYENLEMPLCQEVWKYGVPL